MKALSLDKIAKRNIFIKEGQFITEISGRLEASMLQYKFFIEQKRG
jgi:hypothetical protein